MTPSWTDHRFLWPSQPSRSLPLNSLMVFDSPLRGGMTGASFASLLAAPVVDSDRIRENPVRTMGVKKGMRFMVCLRAGMVYLERPYHPSGGDATSFHATAVSPTS